MVRGIAAILLMSACSTVMARQSASGSVKATASVTELEGTWDGLSSIGNGGAPHALPSGQTRFTFVGQKLLAVGLESTNEVEYTFSVNPGVTPKELDYWIDPKKKSKVSYELNGKDLRIAWGSDSDVRPLKVESTMGSRVALLVLRRHQP